MTVAQAEETILAWLAVDHVRVLYPSESTFRLFFDQLRVAGVGGNLSTDAMIATMALEYGGAVYSNDRDFDRFPSLKWINPLAESRR